MQSSLLTGDLVYLKLDGEIIPSTLGVITSSMKTESSHRILWLDSASSGSQAWYHETQLRRVPDETYEIDIDA
jgi:hypothetical protein